MHPAAKEIEPTMTSRAFYAVLVLNKNDTLRFYADFETLSTAMYSDASPLFWIEDHGEPDGEAAVFVFLDSA